ncbi:hypothetical protein GCM10029976_074670 [Kribbella albertanoniae]|uniref:Uncharacterized protein n=1 Tax=Kribbella albertanoniae TaxID=1266829 RepID=A0A4R4QB67_9ACTN|nr:hypothetical protein [Kribbella albertanoniae]TDC32618.1 hypothetical protein E1261_08235 [Kribbella albertanoniae]
MGAKDWMLVYADRPVADVLRAHPTVDRQATRAFVERLHPGATLTPLEDGNLDENANPPDGVVYAGVFPEATVLLSGEVALDHPSTLPGRFLAEAQGRTLYLHAMHSVVAWFAYGVWEDGVLRRALSLSPDSGVLEDLGEPLPFEVPYWAGERPLYDEDEEPDKEDEFPFVFHPLELAEAALRTFFGFNYEGEVHNDDPKPHEIMLLGYRLS